MSPNLLEIARHTFDDTLRAKIHHAFDLSAADTHKLCQVVWPILFSGLLYHTSSLLHAHELYEQIISAKIDTHLNHTGALATDKFESQGNHILNLLFGHKANILQEHIAELSETPAPAAQQALALSAGALFGLLKKNILDRQLSPHGFATLLLKQTRNFDHSLSSNTTEWLNWGSSSTFIHHHENKIKDILPLLSHAYNSSTTHDSDDSEYTSSTLWKWILPFTLLSLFVLLVNA
ncbi:MAG: DUF937 domain-containing protein [Formosimonas sp.]